MPFRVHILSPLKATETDLERRQQRYAEHAREGTVVTVRNLTAGPPALNTGGDILVSAAAIFRENVGLNRAVTDAILIDCVFDPAVDELAEATGLPVFGPTRTTLPIIDLVSPDFAIVARSQRQCEILADLVDREGYGDRLVSVRALDISYEQAQDPAVFNRVMVARLRQVAREDMVGAILLGSTTMAQTPEMREAAGVPLFMPGMVALRLIEQLWVDGLWPAAGP